MISSRHEYLELAEREFFTHNETERLNNKDLELMNNDNTQENDNFAELVNDIMNNDKNLSYSSLSQFIKSPKHFKEAKTGKFETTKAMEEGKRFHCACLEPEVFEATYWVLDDTEKCAELIAGGAKSPRASKVYKAWRAEQIALNEGKEMIDKAEYEKYQRMNTVLRTNRISGPLMKGLIATEQEFNDVICDFKFRGFIDGIGENPEKHKYLIDLKKVADASYDKIKWDIFKKNYDMQGGLYSEATGINEYWLLFIDNACNITCVKLSRPTLESGFAKLETALAHFQDCAETNAWNESYEFYQDFIEV